MQVQNQFAQAPVQGMPDLKFDPSTISVEIDGSSAGGLVAGQAVTLVDSADGVPKVVEAAADTDDVFGFLQYDIKSKTYEPYDKAEISFFRGNVMYMTASAAIARGAKVAIVVSGSKIVTASTGQRIVGRALDKAAADGDLIRVIIDLPGALA